MKLRSGLKTAGVWLWKAITAPLVGELVALALPSILIVLRQGLQVFGDTCLLVELSANESRRRDFRLIESLCDWSFLRPLQNGC